MKHFSVLLVDDEELAIRGIEMGVQWESLYVERVYKAHSKATAIRMMEDYSIDIIVSDVEMPNGSGLELIRWVTENRPEIVSVFYTGHAEFLYAQEAIRLGVQDYLLKPVPYDELERIILKAEEKLLKKEGSRMFETVWNEVSKEDRIDEVDKVKRFIVEHLEDDLQRDTLAGIVHMNPTYLSRVFKKQEGISLSEYILKKRILVAKQLLEKTNLSVSAIAARVGISYSSYFTKVFREQEFMTPVQYREMMRKK